MKRKRRSAGAHYEVIFYRPRIRLFRDKQGDFHLAGEPDGFSGIMEGLRSLHRGLKRTTSVALVTLPIPPGRNPVGGQGIARIYSKLVLSIATKDEAQIEIRPLDGICWIRLGVSALPKFFLAISEAHDGEGDFSLQVTEGKRLKSVGCNIWFWGYSNPHGVNTF